MSDKELITLLFFLIAFIIIIILTIKEVENMIAIKKTFKCKYCNTLNKEIYNGCKCKNCNRVYNNLKIEFEHYILFRVNEIDTSIKKSKYLYSKYIKYSKLELTICIISAIALVSTILILALR